MVPMAPAGFAPPRAAWGVATSKSLGEGTRVYPIVTFMFCVMIASFPIELPQRLAHRARDQLVGDHASERPSRLLGNATLMR